MEVSYSKAGCLFEGFDILPKVFFSSSYSLLHAMNIMRPAKLLGVSFPIAIMQSLPDL